MWGGAVLRTNDDWPAAWHLQWSERVVDTAREFYDGFRRDQDLEDGSKDDNREPSCKMKRRRSGPDLRHSSVPC
jgi:hypothetical protein